jgi:hypothetical protein
MASLLYWPKYHKVSCKTSFFPYTVLLSVVTWWGIGRSFAHFNFVRFVQRWFSNSLCPLLGRGRRKCCSSPLSQSWGGGGACLWSSISSRSCQVSCFKQQHPSPAAARHGHLQLSDQKPSAASACVAAQAAPSAVAPPRSVSRVV